MSKAAYTQNVKSDSIIVKSIGGNVFLADTRGNKVDSTGIDSIKIKQKNIKISPDAITSVIKYGALDSNFTNIVNKEVHLYGSAYANYETIKLKADYIVFNFATNIVSAYMSTDTLLKKKTKPSFVDGETKAGFAEMKYNFKTKKAIVKEMNTQEDEFFLLGETSKYIGKENDSIYHEDKFYNQNALITTCNHPSPHFGIRTRRMKMIPDKIAVIGPAQLEIAGIPTPLFLPFGFFPLIKGQSAGLIFPSDFPYDGRKGFGIKEVGYYFPISDKIDARITGDIWTRGSHSVRLNTNYVNRYKYSGSININYSNNLDEDLRGQKISQKSFGFTVSHNQDPKAHPYRTLGGSINIQTNRNQQRTNYDYQSVVGSNVLTSNFNYTYRWPESPFSFRSAFSHRQDNTTRKVDITLPDASLSMNTIQPFKRKNSTGDPLWYENISVGYSAAFRNSVRTTDTTLFSKQTLDNMVTGFGHGGDLSTNFRLFTYFNVSPNFSYDEAYFFKTLQKTFDPTPVNDTIITGKDAEGKDITEIRTVKYGTVSEQLVNDLEVFRKMDASISLNTQLFASKRWRKGWLRGIRHIAKPNISFNISPDTYERYRDSVSTDSRVDKNKIEYYNPFQNGAFPQSLSGKQMAISYGINNVFEAKYRNKKDTVDKKLSLFNNISVNGSYNFAADSMQWSDVFISGSTPLFKSLSNLQLSASFTPYVINYKTMRKENQLLIKRTTDKKLLQLVGFSANINTGLSFSQIKGIFEGKTPEETKAREAKEKKAKKTSYDVSLSSLFDKLRISHNFSLNTAKTITGKDSLFVSTHSIYISGSIPLSKNWTFNIGSISYDLKAKALVYPSFSFTRDLHCWNMNFNWYPDSGVYSFFIGVKAGAFNFLKYDYNNRIY